MSIFLSNLVGQKLQIIYSKIFQNKKSSEHFSFTFGCQLVFILNWLRGLRLTFHPTSITCNVFWWFSLSAVHNVWRIWCWLTKHWRQFIELITSTSSLSFSFSFPTVLSFYSFEVFGCNGWPTTKTFSSTETSKDFLSYKKTFLTY